MNTTLTAAPVISDWSELFDATFESLPAPLSACQFTEDGRLKSWVDENGFVQRSDIPENAHVRFLERKYQVTHGGAKCAPVCEDLNGPVAESIWTTDNFDYTAIK
jgi:hypothetical protein